jgi:hypothetical protein
MTTSDLFDYEKPIEERILLINQHPDPFDIVKRISGMYEFSGTRIVQEYLIYIVKTSTISSIIKADAVKSLFTFQEYEEVIKTDDTDHMKTIKTESNDMIKIRNAKRLDIAYDTLMHLCLHFDTDIATPYKLDMIHMLMVNKTYFIHAKKAFAEIIDQPEIDMDYRYKCVLALENKKTIPQKEQYIISFLFSIIYNKFNPTAYRILASQNILQNYIVDVKDRISIENQLLFFARDGGLDYNVRADSCDVIINVGITEEIKTQANEILVALGAMFGVVKTVYDNAQNVHNKKIEESALPIIRFLLQKDQQNTQTYEMVTAEIDKLLIDRKIDSKNIKLSLNRIAIDRSLYHNTSLTTILTKLFFYITSHENEDTKEELLKRLWEELEDMAGTCSSGFLMRLLNTLSGFEEGLSLQISYEEQIVANFVGRLNYYTKYITSSDSPFFHEKYEDVLKLCGCGLDKESKEDIVETFQENVLAEMTENTSNWSSRLNFSLFFRTYLSKLREELYQEFKSFVTDTEFDLAIRRAISTYEGVKFMA